MLFFIFIACQKEVIHENDGIQVLNSSKKSSLSFEKNASLLKKFLKSPDYKSVKNSLIDYGKIDEKASYIENIEIEGVSKNILVLTFVDFNNRVTAKLEVIELSEKGFLPKNQVFAMNLIDFNEFNFKTLSGEVIMHDLNYDFCHSLVRIEANIVKSWSTSPMPEEIKIKYQNLRKKGKNTLTSLVASVGCAGADGNLSFGDCYKCMTDAIANDGFSQFLSDFPATSGMVFTSKAAACIYLSARY